MPSMEFTLMIGCPLKCTFCPQDSLRGKYGNGQKYMAMSDFRTILGKLPGHLRIEFSGMAEIWAHPEATAMLRIALEAGYTIALYTTLYGLSPGECPEVIDMLRRHAGQIEVLCLHLPDRNGNMRGWRYSPEYEANLRAFITFGLSGALRNFQAMTMDRDGKPHHDLDHMGIQLGKWEGHTRAGNVNGEALPQQPVAPMPQHEGAVGCSYTPFYDQNVCLPNGDVVLCCMDYSIQHKVGNLLQQDYYEMFASGGLAALAAENMTPRFSRNSLCKTCDRARRYNVGAVKQFWAQA